MWLRQLASDTEQIRKQAIWHLTGSICHQGWICPATAYAVPFLIELLQEPAVQGKNEVGDAVFHRPRNLPLPVFPSFLLIFTVGRR